MWEVKIWMFRELWALILVVLFASPLHQLSQVVWDKLLGRVGRKVAPRASRGEFWVTFFIIQVLLVLLYLTVFLMSLK